MKQRAIILLLIIFSFPIIPAQADPVSDTGAGMVSNGIDMFFGAAGKALTGGKNETDFKALTTFYNPLDNPVVVASIKNTSVFGFTIFIAYILLGMSYLVLQSSKPKAAQAAEYIFNNGKSYNLEAFVKKCGTIIALFIFILIIMTAILFLAQAFSDMMDNSSMQVIQTSSKSGIITFIYSIFWLILTILLTLRNLILTFIYCFVIILVTAWAFSIFEKPIELIGIYFLIIAFMQPVMVGIAAIGIQTIEYLKTANSGFVGAAGMFSVTLALLILLVVIAAAFIIGPIYFHKLFFEVK